jgi:hypothetical protein
VPPEKAKVGPTKKAAASRRRHLCSKLLHKCRGFISARCSTKFRPPRGRDIAAPLTVVTEPTQALVGALALAPRLWGLVC